MLDRFEKLMVDQCAPTLAGIKPASLFRIGGAETAEIFQTAEFWDHQLRSVGIRVMVLKECPHTGACMIYLYRQEWLDKILKRQSIRQFLLNTGYILQDTVSILHQLSHRFCLEQEYPHEVGIFLGYPLRDVVGFIENRGRNYTCCGYWKCYGNPIAARKCFDRYRDCTARFKQLHENGTSIMQLVSAA